MKTVIDAVNELRVCDPTHRLTNPGWYINQIGALSFNGQQVCTREEFNKCVDEMSKAEWIKPKEEAKTINTATALYAFAGWLTSMDKPITFSSNHWATPAADMVAAIIDANNIAGDCDFDNYIAPKDFKFQTPPIDLIDGEAYKFIYNGKFNIGIYDSDDGRFYFPRGYVLSSYPTNIKHLTV